MVGSLSAKGRHLCKSDLWWRFLEKYCVVGSMNKECAEEMDLSWIFVHEIGRYRFLVGTGYLLAFGR